VTDQNGRSTQEDRAASAERENRPAANPGSGATATAATGMPGAGSELGEAIDRATAAVGQDDGKR
jgi:hypothetical protein